VETRKRRKLFTLPVLSEIQESFGSDVRVAFHRASLGMRWMVVPKLEDGAGLNF